ncbi:MAG: tetratricopeptide repeat protein [Limnochordaceae bacterium]|nr:tetratricopeptide repeat protein [Limnochordaceae bacterium]
MATDTAVENGYAYWLLDSPALAERQWQQVLQVEPTNAEARLGLALGQAAAGDLLQAAETLAAAVDQDPAFAWAAAWQGEFLRLAGERQQAREAYQRALSSQEGAPAALALYGLALLDEEESHYDQAEAGFRQALQANPFFFEAYLGLARCQKARGQLDEAVASLRRGIEIYPLYAPFHLLLGQILSAQGQTVLGQQEIDRALQLDPSLVAAGYASTGGEAQGGETQKSH